MRLGYNTNGLAHHRLVDAIQLLAEEGYQSVGLTLDAGALDPYLEPAELDRQIGQVLNLFDEHGLACVIETGARYLLNPKKKHDPTLVDPDPARRALRVDFYRRAIDIAARLDAPLISLWSGILPDAASDEVAYQRMTDGLRDVLAHAESHGILVAFEPEPGMFIDTFARFKELDERINHPLFQLTVDVGHVHCLEAGTIGSHLRAWGPRIVNIHVEDMVRGVHEHLMFGEGTLDLEDTMRALQDIRYEGGVHVELSRQSHMAVEAVRKSAQVLRPWIGG